MQIAIASGKGGTGKTTLATNLAVTLAWEGRAVHLLDCDVEEPDCHLFVEPHIEHAENVYVPVPKIDNDRCAGCGLCADVCEFNALACLGSHVVTFPELCHSCGGCWLVCPEEAIEQGRRELGVLETGTASNCTFTQGRLRVGEAHVPPLIRRVKAEGNESELVIIDSPPGTSCSAIEAMRGSDYVVLVTEPTPFGLNDLMLAVETVSQLGCPFGVVVNRADAGDDRVRRYCREESVTVLLEIPDDRRVAVAYSEGELAVNAVPELYASFLKLYRDISARCEGGVACENS